MIVARVAHRPWDPVLRAAHKIVDTTLVTACATSAADYALLPFQLAWYDDESRLQAYAKSRQIGITWVTAAKAVMTASLKESAGGMDVYFMTTGQDDARKFIDECAKWIKRLTPAIRQAVAGVQESDAWFKDDEGNKILTLRIDFPSGFSIYALPSRPARLRGKQGWGICDEAAQQDLTAWMKAASGLLAWGGRWSFISTYFGVDNDFYRLVQELKSDKPGSRKGTLHETDIYQAIDQGLYRRICRVKGKRWSEQGQAEWLAEIRDTVGEEAFAEEYECLASRAGASIFSPATIKACCKLGRDRCTVVEIKGGTTPTIWCDGVLMDSSDQPWPRPSDAEGSEYAPPEERTKIMKGWLATYVAPALERFRASRERAYAGSDYGRTQNLTTTLVGTKTRHGRREIGLVLELEQMPWPEQDTAHDFLWERLPNLEAGCGDATGAGGPSSERARDRTKGKFRPINLSEGWHRPAFERVRASLEAERLLLPADFEPLAEDLRSLTRGPRRKVIAPQRTSKDRRKQVRHADAAFALALFEQAAITVPDEPIPIGRRRRTKFPRIRI